MPWPRGWGGHARLAADPSPEACTTLLDVCLTNTAYDPQVEGSRAPYLAA
ncbi:MAG TPA: hypothetical protein VK081_14080 [Planctomycetota bacterium]|nr:hypothetical protein [Planctomycetota bacterium]